MLDDVGSELYTTAAYSDQIGEVLKEVEGPAGSYDFRGDELYVRAVVVSDRPHANPTIPGDTLKAWTQPVCVGRTG